MDGFEIGDRVQLNEDENLLSGWRGIGVVTRITHSTIIFKKSDGGLAEVTPDQISLVNSVSE